MTLKITDIKKYMFHNDTGSSIITSTTRHASVVKSAIRTQLTNLCDFKYLASSRYRISW